MHLDCLDNWRFASGKFGACTTCNGAYSQQVRTDLNVVRVAWACAPTFSSIFGDVADFIKTYGAYICFLIAVQNVQLYFIFWFLDIEPTDKNYTRGFALAGAVELYGRYLIGLYMTKPQWVQHLVGFTPILLVLSRCIDFFDTWNHFLFTPAISYLRRVRHERMEVAGLPVF